jgi:hypothetical protein
MRLSFALSLLSAALLATPVIAGAPATKRSLCQLPKAAARDARRPDPCRKPAIPPVIDPTPMFLASTAASPALLSDLS